MPSKKTEKGWSHFCSENHFKNTNHIVYPFTKARREKINELQAMIFDEESAGDAQKILAPPKRMILQKRLTQKKRLKKTEEGWSHVWPQNHFKNTNHIVYPFAKARREKINELQAMNFDDGSAYTHFYYSKFSKNGNSSNKKLEKNDANFFWKKIINKNVWASKNEMSGIVWNAFWQSLVPIGAMFEG